MTKILRVGKRGVNERVKNWFFMKFTLVQILVVVANIQVKILKTEVEKGFMRTAIVHELVDPKFMINLMKIFDLSLLRVVFRYFFGFGA